jgi:hypothetical protein
MRVPKVLGADLVLKGRNRGSRDGRAIEVRPFGPPSDRMVQPFGKRRLRLSLV